MKFVLILSNIIILLKRQIATHLIPFLIAHQIIYLNQKTYQMIVQLQVVVILMLINLIFLTITILKKLNLLSKS